MSLATDHQRVSTARKIAYGLPAFALAVVGIPVYVYLPKFYTDVVGIDVLALGTILFAVRIFDAVTDPAMGYLSDRTRSVFGRRRPYIALGAVCLAAVMLLLFNPPVMTSAAATAWFAAGIFGLFLFWTVVTVPYESLGPEITFDYRERVGLFALRDGLLIAGTLAAAASPALVRGWLGAEGQPADERAVFFWISTAYAPLIVATAWGCVAVVKERPAAPPVVQRSLLDGLRQVRANRPFLILLAAYTVSAVGNNLPATLILYYVQYVLQSPHADLFLLLYFVTGILFLPAWIILARRIGKKEAWLAAMAVNSGAFLGVFFLGPGDAMLYGILVFLSGIGFGATLAIPSAMQADVIDYDELLSGERREGQYIGLWSIAKKLAAALGIGVGLTLLGLAGYTPNTVQNETVLWSLRILYALVPSVCNLIGMGIALAYPIDSHAHRRIREAAARRRSGQAYTDPLAMRSAAG